MSFGERLKKLRLERGVSQKKVASVMQVSERAIRWYETDERRPKYDQSVAIARFFGVTTDYLFGNEGADEDCAESTIDLNVDMDTEEAERVEPYTLSEVLDATHEAGKWSSATEMMEFAAWAHPKINTGSLFFIDGGERRSFLRARVRDERILWEEGKKK